MNQLNSNTKQSIVSVKKKSQQSGFVILMGLLILVLGAAVWFGSLGNLRSEEIKLTNQSDDVEALEHIKDKMLTYALLYPELFFDNNDTPGPGYFPCPDTTGDGLSNGGCVAGNALFVIGMVPQQIVNRVFSFLPSNQQTRRYWFAVDSRYLVGASNTATGRIGSLNSLTSSLVDTAGGAGFCNDPNTGLAPVAVLPATCVAPITLDGRGDLVMILFDAGEPLNQHRGNLPAGVGFANANMGQFLEQPPLPALGAPANFVSVGNNPDTFNDRIVTITREEWNATMLSRVSVDVNPADGVVDLCTIPDSAVGVQSWFNRCSGTSSSLPNYPCISPPNPNPNNLEGQGWRFVLGC